MANPVLGTLETQITTTKGVIESAIVLIGGVQARIDSAVQAAIANGATAEELAPFTALSAALGTDTDALAAAVAANTPPAPPGPVAGHKKP